MTAINAALGARFGAEKPFMRSLLPELGDEYQHAFPRVRDRACLDGSCEAALSQAAAHL
jgi:hypothetical protein